VAHFAALWLHFSTTPVYHPGSYATRRGYVASGSKRQQKETMIGIIILEDSGFHEGADEGQDDGRLRNNRLPGGSPLCQTYHVSVVSVHDRGYPDIALIKRKGCSRATRSIGNSNRCGVCVTANCGRG